MGNSNSNAKLSINLNNHNQPLSTGDRLEGRICLNIDHKFILCDQLRIKLRGIEMSTKFNKDAENYRIKTEQVLSSHKITQKKELDQFYNYDDCIHTFTDGKLTHGQYEYAFSILLPSNIPSSFTTTSCAVTYTLEAWLERTGLASKDISYYCDIKIVKPVQLPEPLPLLIGPCDARMTKFFGRSAGIITVGAMASIPGATPGDTFKVYYTLSNHSTKRIKALIITLYEDINLNLYKRNTRTRCILYTTRIDAKQLPESHKVNTLQSALSPLTHVRHINPTLSSLIHGYFNS